MTEPPAATGPPATGEPSAEAPAGAPARSGPSANSPGGLAQAVSDQFSAQAVLGGPRGLLEAVLPMTLFSVAYGLGLDLRTAILVALGASGGFVLWRLVAREPVTQAISGALAIGLGAWLALRTGRAENVVVPSLIKNSLWGAAYAISALVRWPLVGVLLGMMRAEGTRWRQDRARARAYGRATWAWVAMFGIRLAVQFPLWLAGQAVALGLVNVLLGLPLFGLTIWVTWWLIRSLPPLPAAEHSHRDHPDVVEAPSA